MFGLLLKRLERKYTLLRETAPDMAFGDPDLNSEMGLYPMFDIQTKNL
jgi:hypothetical protein